jgi:hypothetical protein
VSALAVHQRNSPGKNAREKPIPGHFSREFDDREFPVILAREFGLCLGKSSGVLVENDTGNASKAPSAGSCLILGFLEVKMRVFHNIIIHWIS